MRKVILLLSGVFLFTAAAQGQQLLQYTFTGADPGGDLDTPVVAGLSVTPFMRSTFVLQSSRPDVFESMNFDPGTDPSPNGGQTKYISFTLTATAPGTLNLFSLNFSATNANALGSQVGGPTTGDVRLFINGSATPAANIGSYGIGFSSVQFDFADQLNIDSAEFRFYATGLTTLPTGVFNVDNVTVFGTVIPEPSTWMLGLVGIGVLIAARRWRAVRV